MYKLAIISGVALILLVGLGQSPSNKRSYVAGRFALSLDGSAELDLLRSVGGGAAVGQVVGEVMTGTLDAFLTPCRVQVNAQISSGRALEAGRGESWQRSLLL